MSTLVDVFNPPMVMEFTISPALNHGPCGATLFPVISEYEMTCTNCVGCRRVFSLAPGDMDQARVHRLLSGAAFQN